MSIFLHGVFTFLLALLMVALHRSMALHWGLVDKPGGRKTHGEIVPVIGGVAIFIAACGSLLFVPELGNGHRWLILAASVLVMVGLLDDRYQLRASLRMYGQGLVACLMVFGAGLSFETIGAPFFTGEVSLGWLSIPVTVLVVMTVINAVNMTDGMDGLAGSTALVGLLPMLLLAYDAGRWEQARFLVILVAAVMAFLVFNFPVKWNRPFRTFMGDAGSTFLGLVIIWMGVEISTGDDRLISPVAGLWFIAAPVHDLFASAIRRGRKGQAFWIPDLGHAHHILLKAGFTTRQTLLSMMGMATLYALIGLSGPYLGVPDGVLFILWILVGIWHTWVVQRAWVFSKILEIVRTEL